MDFIRYSTVVGLGFIEVPDNNCSEEVLDGIPGVRL